MYVSSFLKCFYEQHVIIVSGWMVGNTIMAMQLITFEKELFDHHSVFILGYQYIGRQQTNLEGEVFFITCLRILGDFWGEFHPLTALK